MYFTVMFILGLSLLNSCMNGWPIYSKIPMKYGFNTETPDDIQDTRFELYKVSKNGLFIDTFLI